MGYVVRGQSIPRFFSRMCSALVLALLIAGVQISGGGSSAQAAQAASRHEAVTRAVSPLIQARPLAIFTHNCGIITCSIYFTRGTTRWIANNGVPAVIGLGFIPEVGPYLAAAGGLIVWKAGQAKGKNQCLRVRYVIGIGTITGLYSDGSHYCKN